MLEAGTIPIDSKTEKIEINEVSNPPTYPEPSLTQMLIWKSSALSSSGLSECMQRVVPSVESERRCFM